MKILHINFSDTGGAAKAAMNLHFKLLENNVDSKFLGLNLQKEYDAKDHIYSHRRIYNTFLKKLYYLYFLPVLLKFKNRKVHRANLASPEILSSPYSNFDITLDPLYKEADVIHLHWTARFLDYPTFFKKNKKPIVWTLHDKNPFSGILHCETGFPKGFLELEFHTRKQKQNWIAKQRIIVHSPSKEYLDLSVKSTVLGKFEHVRLPHFIVGFYKIDRKTKLDLRDELNLELKGVLVLVIADELNRKLKGIEEVLDFAQENSDIHFVFIGRKLKVELPSNVIQLGYVHDINKMNMLYNASNLTLSNSCEESFGLVVAESLMAGTPVASRVNSGAIDLIHHDENGVLYSQELNRDIINKALTCEFENKELVQINNYFSNLYSKVLTL